MIALAKITNRRKSNFDCLSICDVTCPKCEHVSTVSYCGWTALRCGGCGVELHREVLVNSMVWTSPAPRAVNSRKHQPGKKRAAGQPQAAEPARFCDGQRVQTLQPLECFPHFLVDRVGLLGTVCAVSDASVWIKMDEHIDGCGPWNNKVSFFIGEEHHDAGILPVSALEILPCGEQRVIDIVEDAQLAFWAVVAERIAEAGGGDLPIDATRGFGQACASAVELWIQCNVPQGPRCDACGEFVPACERRANGGAYAQRGGGWLCADCFTR